MSKEAAPAEAAPPKKKGKLLIIILLVVGVLVLAGGGAAFFLLTSKPDAQKVAGDHGEEAGHDDEEGGEGEGEEGADEHPVYEKLETFTVNLADQESYLQTEIQLQVADIKVQEKIKAHMPEVRDTLIRLLSSKTAEELTNQDGKDKLAEEIQKSLNQVLGIKKKSKGVRKVLFAAFIIQ